MKRTLKVMLTGVIILGILLPVTGCGSKDDNASTQTQTATVQKGDLSVEITSVGNLSLSQTEDLAFDMAGTVEEVMVETGDTVTAGQELVRLDSSEWEDQIKTYEDRLVTAQRAQTTAERLVGTKELAVRSAELDVQTAEYNLEQLTDVKKAKDEVDKATTDLDIAKSMLNSGLNSTEWLEAINNAKEALALAQVKYNAVLAGTSVSLTTSATIQIEKYKLAVEQQQRALEDANIALENARVDAESAVDDVTDAQDNLDEAEALSPIITAPFDGFITRVNVEGGDEVLKGTVAVQIADPDKFEADIVVSEMDISQVKLGGSAYVEVDSFDGLTLPAEVTFISPTATISSGVVNYTVQVEVQSLEAIAEERQQAREQMASTISSGEMPDMLKQAVASGRMTQEQADAMVQRMQSGEMPAPGGRFGQGTASSGGSTGQLPMMAASDNVQLKEGMTVTVNIVVSSVTDALLIPYAAVTTTGRQSTVQVVKDDGTTEQRTVTTGITDYTNIDITEGLSEGEKVIVPQGTTVTTSSQNQQFRGGMMIPGMGGGR
jgi:HlyD family secretion protein